MSDKRDIAKDRAMCEAATPGPWHRRRKKVLTDSQVDAIGQPWGKGLVVAGSVVVTSTIEGFRHLNTRELDAEFIAESRTALPHYLDRTELAEAMLNAAVDLIIEIARDDIELCEKICDAQWLEKCDLPHCIRAYLAAKAKEAQQK